jgi:hypothetical protein
MIGGMVPADHVRAQSLPQHVETPDVAQIDLGFLPIPRGESASENAFKESQSSVFEMMVGFAQKQGGAAVRTRSYDEYRVRGFNEVLSAIVSEFSFPKDVTVDITFGLSRTDRSLRIVAVAATHPRLGFLLHLFFDGGGRLLGGFIDRRTFTHDDMPAATRGRLYEVPSKGRSLDASEQFSPEEYEFTRRLLHGIFEHVRPKG